MQSNHNEIAKQNETKLADILMIDIHIYWSTINLVIMGILPQREYILEQK